MSRCSASMTSKTISITWFKQDNKSKTDQEQSSQEPQEAKDESSSSIEPLFKNEDTKNETDEDSKSQTNQNSMLEQVATANDDNSQESISNLLGENQDNESNNIQENIENDNEDVFDSFFGTRPHEQAQEGAVKIADEQFDFESNKN